MLCVLLALALSACNRQQPNTSSLGTFRMGDRVQAGGLVYQVLEAEWRPSLGDPPAAKTPAHRFLVVRLSIANQGSAAIAVPALTLEGSNKRTYTELMEGVDALPNWLGALRMVGPAQTEQGSIVFDAPVGAYKLHLSDGGDIESEKTAQVDIPAQLGEGPIH